MPLESDIRVKRTGKASRASRRAALAGFAIVGGIVPAALAMSAIGAGEWLWPFMIGGVLVTVALVLLVDGADSAAVVDRTSPMVSLGLPRVLERQKVNFAFEDVECVVAEERLRSDGASSWIPVIVLNDGHRVDAASCLPSLAEAEKVAALLRAEVAEPPA